jgi:hypothetical protein
MDGMFCVTPGVGVSMYMWVYVISIMEAWKYSTKGHNNLAKLNGSQASICRRFKLWYQHMALVGDMTIEELVLFYFQKKFIRDFHHTKRQSKIPSLFLASIKSWTPRRQRSTLLPRLLLRTSPDSPEPQWQRQNSVPNTPRHLLLQGHDFWPKNARVTYQKAIQKCLKSQIGRNVEAYVDDVVIKTTEEDQLITDLAETFTNLLEFQWNLNSMKCVFGVPSGLLLGFMVGHWGIEANPVKVDAICNMAKPCCKKDVMNLIGMMATLGRFRPLLRSTIMWLSMYSLN